MEEEVKAKKPRLKKSSVPVEAAVKSPEVLEIERDIARYAKRNIEMEIAYAKMAEYVAENEDSEDVDVEFCIDQKAQVVVARVEYLPDIDEDTPPSEVLRLLSRETVKYGLARCAAGDRWNPLLGKYLALKRAKGTKIPASILAAIGHVMY